MREYVLTTIERKMLQKYLGNNIKVQNFRVLMHRIKKNYATLKNDFKLIEDVLQKSQ
jgi:hypothetical protein